ncbi:hypothetical protein [Ralstonia sp.]|uniref:hypothetical protein n=1 Tax=Ralstonia sp. TaxID=54061 RepID=UPI0031DBA5D6
MLGHRRLRLSGVVAQQRYIGWVDVALRERSFAMLAERAVAVGALMDEQLAAEVAKYPH